MLYSGLYEHTIDAKNRLSIPAPIRSQMDPDVGGTGFYVGPGENPTTLSLWDGRTFRTNAERARTEPIPDRRRSVYNRLLYPLATAVQPDKLGRITIPDHLLRRFRIQREVVVIGVVDHMEIWNKADYDSFFDENIENYSDIVQGAFESDREAARERGS